MSVEVFSGAIRGYRRRSEPKLDDFTQKGLDKLLSVLEGTSRAYKAMLEDALKLDPDTSLESTVKLIALCNEVWRMMSTLERECRSRGQVNTEMTAQLKQASKALEEFRSLIRQQKVQLVSESGPRGQNVPIIPWETALELLLHIAVQKDQGSVRLEGIPGLFGRLSKLSRFLSSPEYQGKTDVCGLPSTLFVCCRSGGPAHNITTKTKTEPVTTFIITSTAEQWRGVKKLGDWAFDQGLERRRRLLAKYEPSSAFGLGIEADRKIFKESFALPALSSSPPEGREAAMHQAVQRWLITQGPGRVQMHFDEKVDGNAAAFCLGDQGRCEDKARCAMCRATFCHAMPVEAWSKENLPSKLKETRWLGDVMSCVELPGRVLCNEAMRMQKNSGGYLREGCL